MDIFLSRLNKARFTAGVFLLVSGLAWSGFARAEDEGLVIHDLDMFYSERLDVVNKTGKVLDLRDIVIDTQKEVVGLPAYTLLPDYSVRIWIGKGPQKYKPAPNEIMLLLDRDLFDNTRGIVTLRHKTLGELSETWYGGKGIWSPAPKPEKKVEEGIALIPFDKQATGGPPGLPALPPLPGAAKAPAAPVGNKGGFEFEVVSFKEGSATGGISLPGAPVLKSMDIVLEDLRSAEKQAADPGYSIVLTGDGMLAMEIGSEACVKNGTQVVCKGMAPGSHPPSVTLRVICSTGKTGPNSKVDCSKPKTFPWQ